MKIFTIGSLFTAPNWNFRIPKRWYFDNVPNPRGQRLLQTETWNIGSMLLTQFYGFSISILYGDENHSRKKNTRRLSRRVSKSVFSAVRLQMTSHRRDVNTFWSFFHHWRILEEKIRSRITRDSTQETRANRSGWGAMKRVSLWPSNGISTEETCSRPLNRTVLRYYFYDHH